MEPQESIRSELLDWIDASHITWKADISDLKFCLHQMEAYDWTISSVPKRRLKISIKKDERTVASWIGDWGSLFVIHKDKLLYVPFTSTFGGQLFCVDLRTGEEHWKTDFAFAEGKPLGEFGPYYALRTLRVMSHRNQDFALIVSCESAGGWIALIDFETGRLIAEREKELQFSDPEPKWCPCRRKVQTPRADVVPKSTSARGTPTRAPAK